MSPLWCPIHRSPSSPCSWWAVPWSGRSPWPSTWRAGPPIALTSSGPVFGLRGLGEATAAAGPVAWIRDQG
eukprot:206349-Alexandrium_andersonii.AAC.1